MPIRIIDGIFVLLFVTVITLSSLGMHNSLNIDYQPCYIASLATNSVCKEHSGPDGRGNFYEHYIEYNVTIPNYNVTTTGMYYCSRDSCSICVGVGAIKIGVLRQCYTEPLIKPNYVIINTIATGDSKLFYILSIIGFASLLLGTSVYVRCRFFGNRTYQAIN